MGADRGKEEDRLGLGTGLVAAVPPNPHPIPRPNVPSGVHMDLHQQYRFCGSRMTHQSGRDLQWEHLYKCIHLFPSLKRLLEAKTLPWDEANAMLAFLHYCTGN